MKHFTWWILVSKKEMTRLWAGDSLICVTLVHVLPQVFVRLKTTLIDWYDAVVVAYGHTWATIEKNDGLMEYRLDDISAYQSLTIWDAMPITLDKELHVTGVSKWKGFQWWIKRFHLHGMPATHGHKFTRVVWSMGNRKPRRTMKWHPAAWRMWTDTVSIKHIPIVDSFEREWKHYIALKWSVPGWRNNVIKAYF